MPVDPTGTQPGLPSEPEPDATINMKCANPRCPSITAIEVKVGVQGGPRIYRCTRCHATRTINVGGFFPF